MSSAELLPSEKAVLGKETWGWTQAVLFELENAFNKHHNEQTGRPDRFTEEMNFFTILENSETNPLPKCCLVAELTNYIHDK